MWKLLARAALLKKGWDWYQSHKAKKAARKAEARRNLRA